MVIVWLDVGHHDMLESLNLQLYINSFRIQFKEQHTPMEFRLTISSVYPCGSPEINFTPLSGGSGSL